MAILLVSSFQVVSQKPVRVTRAEGVLIQKKLVILFENSNFSGASKSFGPGEYLLTDFNDQAASIRVPDGLVAYLYEHASQGKGYGIAVDLLEDVADLSTLQFSKKLSGKLEHVQQKMPNTVNYFFALQISLSQI